MNKLTVVALLALGVGLVGCGDDDDVGGGDASVDGSSRDATADTGGGDARADARPDARPDGTVNTDPCFSEMGPTPDTFGCNGTKPGAMAADNAFAGLCTPGTGMDVKGSCTSATAACLGGGGHVKGLCLEICEPTPDSYTSTSTCPDGSRCFPTGTEGVGLCFPDCEAGADCKSGVCDGDKSCTLPVDCEAYCGEVMDACTGDNAQYANMDACMAFCAKAEWAPGAETDTSGNTIGCRIYHSGVAAMGGMEQAAHCGHAGPTGGNACGTWCENMCNLHTKACTGDNSQYADPAACATACGMFPATGTIGAESGNTVQCRLYHLGVASGSDSAAMTHCPHGSEAGGMVCVDPT